MFVPTAAILGQWFEVYNATDGPLLLSGLTIQDGNSQTHLVGAVPPVVVPARSYGVFVRNRTAAIESLIPVDSVLYDYGGGLPPEEGIQLDTGSASALSLWNGSSAIVDIHYGSWGLAYVGNSLELSTLLVQASDDSEGWCLGETPWSPGSDDGTPGAANDCF
jgi:hypothetical protein